MNDRGCAQTGPLRTAAACRARAALDDEPAHFRATIATGHARRSAGAYRPATHPSPDTVAQLRRACYPRLLPIARDRAAKRGRPVPWPETPDEWLALCRRAGDRDARHRDLYGDLVFPLRVVVRPNEPGVEHSGGEFPLAGQRPRARSCGAITMFRQGHGPIFTARGWPAAPVRHGVSVGRSGRRHTCGRVSHDVARRP